MKHLLSLSILTGLICVLLITGSFNKKSASCFQTRKDSINFARFVFNLYKDSELSTPNTAVVSNESISFSDDKFTVVKWDTIQSFASRYDATPIVTGGGLPIRGFLIDEVGMTEIRKLDAKTITKLYLRFGRKPNLDYTVMLLPVNNNGDVAKTDTSNYDHLDPCPRYCTNNFQ